MMTIPTLDEFDEDRITQGLSRMEMYELQVGMQKGSIQVRSTVDLDTIQLIYPGLKPTPGSNLQINRLIGTVLEFQIMLVTK